MRITIQPHEVFTSSLATALYLEEQGARGQTVFPIGEEGLIAALVDGGMRLVTERPQWVVTGLDRQVTYDKLATAALAIRAGARFIGTNPDTSLPTERGFLPGAGAIQAFLVAATDTRPIIIGKPQPLMLELAMRQLGGTIHDTAMVGDRLDTDIQAAQAIGMPSILVLTGVSRRDEIEPSGISPSLVVATLEDLMAQWPVAG